MTLLDSLIDAVLRLDGDSLVMHAGEKPYVVTGIVGQGVHHGPVLWGQVEISSRVITSETLRSMLPQLLQHEHRKAFDEIGAVDFETPAVADRPAFKVIAAQGGDDVWLEVRRVKAARESQADIAGQSLAEPVIAEPAIAKTALDAIEPETPVSTSGVTEAPLEHQSQEMELEVVADEVQQAPSEQDVDALLAATASALLTDLRPATHEPTAVAAALFAVEPRAPRPWRPVPVADRTPERLPKSDAPGSPHIRDLLVAASELGASAMYIVAHSRPMVRIDGEIVPLEGAEVLSRIDVERLRDFLSAQQASPTAADADWHCDIEGVGRVRYLLFQDHRGPGVIFRMLPVRFLSAGKLGLPAAVQALASQTDGLVLVAGAPGSGRTTMLSAFLEQINSTRSDHLIAVASQISFVHESRRSFVSQREAGAGPDAMATAVRQAVAEDPDVLFVDDIATAAVAEIVLDASSRGRLVFASIEAPSSAAALERIIEMFPGERRAQARATLAESLRGVVSQVMLRRAAGGRVAARELLINAPSVAAVLLEGKTLEGTAVIESGRRIGMIPLSDSLRDLVRTGVVHAAEAYRKAVDREALLAALETEGIDTSFAERLA